MIDIFSTHHSKDGEKANLVSFPRKYKHIASRDHSLNDIHFSGYKK